MLAHNKNFQTTYNKDIKVWSGRKCKLQYGPECSIGKVVLEALLKDPEHIAQICYSSGKQYTNCEIANSSISAAKHFKKLGLQQCQIIGVCASNSDYLAPLFFGAQLAGLTVATLDPSFDKDGIKHTFGISKPVAMFCDGDIYEKVKQAIDELNLHVQIYTMKAHIEGIPEVTEFLQETTSDNAFNIENLKLGYHQVAAILCSSGTTGLPKGVCISHASILNATLMNLYPDDKLLCFSTIYWFSGLMSLVCGTAYGATRIILDKPFNTDAFFHIVDNYKPTVVIAPPSQIALSIACEDIRNFDFSSVVSCVCTGSPVSYMVIEQMKAFMTNATFYTAYGMTEVSTTTAVGYVVTTGSTGKITDNIEMKIIDDNGVSLGPNEVGEICTKIAFPWEGYFGNPDTTLSIYDQVWIKSGDLGYFDDDGNLYVVDRKKDILKYNNFHFYPTEIEHVIYELPGIAEACVCGIPDIVSTHLPAVAIVKKPNSHVTEEAVYQHVAERMAHFKQLRGGVYFVEGLPKTVSGKILRRKVTELCEELRNGKTDNSDREMVQNLLKIKCQN